MNLFEDWYICYFQQFTNPHIDVDIEEDLVKGEDGEYLDVRVALMHKAFLAGQVFESDPVLYTKEMQDKDALDADKIYKELSARKVGGETLDWIDEEFLAQHSYINGLVEELIPTQGSYKDKMMACFDEDDNFVGLVGQQENGTYKIIKK